MKKILESIEQVNECPPEMNEHPMPGAMPAMDQGQPVTMNVNMSASGAEHVEDLINMMKNAGLGGAKEVSADMMPMRTDMERLRAIVDEPGDEDPNEELAVEAEGCGCNEGGDCTCPPDCPDCDCAATEGYVNEPDEEYKDHEYMTKDLSGGINREKKQYKAAQPGDNAMAMEEIKAALYAALAEKKAKPDFLDMDKDGDKKEPMKKAIKDKGSKPKKGEVPPQFKK